MKNITEDVIRTTTWSATSKYLIQFAAFFVSMILARLITPDEYGVVAMVTIFVGFITLLNEGGIKSYIIQHINLTKEEESLLFLLSIILGLIFTFVLFMLSEPISTFYNLPELSNVIKILSITLILSSISSVPYGVIERKLQFKKSALIQISTYVISSLLAIILALNHFGYWSLIFQSLFSQFLLAFLIYYFSKWRPSKILTLKKNIFLSLIKYSGNLTLFSIINYWSRNSDNLLIGKYLGANNLGLYNRAYSLMMIPIVFFSSTLNQTLHPIYATIQNDVNVIRSSYLGILKVISLISFPLVVFMSVNAEALIIAVWGSQWYGSVQIFRILSIAAIFQPILNTTGTIFLVRNKTDMLFIIGMVNTIAIISGISIGLFFGVLGVSIGYTISYSIVFIPTMYIVFNKLLLGSIKELFLKLKPSIMLSAIILLLNLIVSTSISNKYLVLVINTLISVSIFYCFLLLYEKEYLINIEELLNKLLKKKIKLRF